MCELPGKFLQGLDQRRVCRLRKSFYVDSGDHATRLHRFARRLGRHGQRPADGDDGVLELGEV